MATTYRPDEENGRQCPECARQLYGDQDFCSETCGFKHDRKHTLPEFVFEPAEAEALPFVYASLARPVTHVADPYLMRRWGVRQWAWATVLGYPHGAFRTSERLSPETIAHHDLKEVIERP